MSLDRLSEQAAGLESMSGLRPCLYGTRHMIATGHYLATQAGFEILEAGGNAFDAGVAAGIALSVVQSELVSFAGVAPIIFYSAERDEVMTISGLGGWPRAVRSDQFAAQGHIPEGILRTVVPAAPDAWIMALSAFGTMRFTDVASTAIRLAREGFVMYPLMAGIIAANEASFRRWPENKRIYLPKNRPPKVGELFVQRDLADTIQYMVDEEAAAKRRGRKAALAAARRAFYEGDIARTILKFHRENGGLLDAADLSEYRSRLEPPVKTRFHGLDVYGCGPWCQGPVLLQILKVLEGFDLAGLGHNSSAYLHIVAEAIKLGFADRHRYYGDPDFVDVPIKTLLSPAYAKARRAEINPERAWREMPPAGAAGRGAASAAGGRGTAGDPKPALDTSYVAVIDKWGNAFSATPSDVASDSPLVPGTGLCPSSRGAQSWADPAHPSSVAPGKRPRLTPNPALAIKRGEMVMPFGTPGGDVQVQAMVQAFLNLVVFGMNPQAAVEAPRFASYSFPDSFEPHAYFPGRINIESRVGEDTIAALKGLGHDAQPWPEWTWRAGAMCMIYGDRKTGVLAAGADPRRPAYALGW